MTATATPPHADARNTDAHADAPKHASTPPAPTRTSEGPSLFLWAEVALACVTLVTVGGLWRLFVDRSYLGPLVAHALAAHLTVTLLRRRGLGLAASAVAVAFIAVLAITWGHLWHTTTYGFPTRETWHAVGDRFEVAWQLFGDEKAPVPVLSGFVLALAAVVWLVAWAADTAAFRLWAPFEALIASGTLFVFASVFGTVGGATGAAALWFAAALAFMLVHRTARQHSSPSWLGSDPRRGSSSLLRGGAGIAAVAVGVAMLSGPNLPGSDATPVIGPDSFDQGTSRQTVSPLVQIKDRLLEQSDTEMFSVVAGTPGYWRLTGLDQFDGDVWSSRGSFEEVGEELGGLPLREGEQSVTQRFSITGMASIWVPAAFEPREIDPVDDTEIRWEPESATLIVANSVSTSDGLTYDVVSALPPYDQELLRAADGEIPDSVIERSTGLPSDFPARVVQEALRVVDGAQTPFDQALALQDHLRNPPFRYSLDAPEGHSATAIESFLFDTRAGYCEQFAGTYAAMARAVGLPARVAVGFTQGLRDPTEPGRYIVTGRFAHAWPEVYLGGVGWVSFEPTPSRGDGRTAGYTGVPAQQEGEGPATEGPGETVPTSIPGETPATLPDGSIDPEGGPITEPTEPAPLGDTSATDNGIDGEDILRVIGWVVLGAVGIALLVVLAGASVAAWRAVRRWRRRARAQSAEDKVRVAWAEAVESVEVLGVTPHRHETPLEFARRLAKAIDGDGRPAPLARTVEQADFAPTGVSDDEAATAVELATGIRGAVQAQTSRRERVLAAADPRPPNRRGRRRGPRPTGPRIQIRGEAR